jgi:energy-coupling factor transporter ATP-binding protein EcfA2
MRLHELHINNFKFFPKQDPNSPLLKIDGKNLLIYGENGSGKSTIYWALYTLLESAFKKNEFEVEKYFKKNGDFGLVNIHATKTSPPYIKAILKDNNGNNPKEYEVNPNLHQIVANMRDSSIRESGMASDFLNYRVIFRLHHIKHTKENNLFGWFEDEIFPYLLINTISRTESVEDNYKNLKQGPKKVKDFEEIDKMIYPNASMREHPQEAVEKIMPFTNDISNRLKHGILRLRNT